MKTAADVKKQIEKLKQKQIEMERRDREKIGLEVQKRTGKETWPEIEPILFPAEKGGE